MGQKTNAIGIRLGNRFSWRSLWNVEKNAFNELFLKDIETRHFLYVFLKAFGISMNNTILGSWNNSLLVSGRLVSVSNFLSSSKMKWFYLSKHNRWNRCIRLLKSIAHVSPRTSDMYFDFLAKHQSFFDFSRRDFLTKKFKTEFLKSKGLRSMKSSEIVKFSEATKFAIPISSQAVADIVTWQIGLPPKLKDKLFRFNPRKGIIWLVKFFFNQHMPFVTGIKIVCSGRWRKTKSSRKQRTIYSFGKIRRQTFSKHVDYGSSSITTKYGVCGVRVWISYKIHQA